MSKMYILYMFPCQREIHLKIYIEKHIFHFHQKNLNKKKIDNIFNK